MVDAGFNRGLQRPNRTNISLRAPEWNAWNEMRKITLFQKSHLFLRSGAEGPGLVGSLQRLGKWVLDRQLSQYILPLRVGRPLGLALDAFGFRTPLDLIDS